MKRKITTGVDDDQDHDDHDHKKCSLNIIHRAPSLSFQWSPGSWEEVTGFNLMGIAVVREKDIFMQMKIKSCERRCEADNGFSALPVAQSLLLVVTCE